MPAKKSSSSSNSSKQTQSGLHLHRSETNRILGGVCGGLALAFDVDASIIRLIFVLLFVFGGSGFLLYILLWLVIPSESLGHASHETVRHGVDEMRGRAREFASKFQNPGQKGNNRQFVGWVILIVGIIFLTNNFGFRLHLEAFLPFIFIIAGFVLISRSRK